ncbi:HET-domain-containing protein [Coniochaeta ligniaria NRRL 30616]|uniref:HET-domain-containing protein n=1 Tax=Coniochaeta ligniaria NRRL 30616 TaxID=1408157 RepID=A0A1J7JLI0_9PEZI|nr:HET-domain-containing protein [Coniochaeta ligniaria NRRL 30616]
MSTPSYCVRCSDVSDRLNNIFSVRKRGVPFRPDEDDQNHVARFGTVKEIFDQTDCWSCIALQKEIRRWEDVYGWERNDDEILGIEITEPPDDDDDDGADLPQLYYLVSSDPDAQGNTATMNLYIPDPLQLSPLDERGRFFDAHHLDIDLVRGWLRCCDETHGDACLQSLVTRLSPDSMPPRLLFVDVEQECLVYGSLDSRYIALSYVWGQVDTLRTTTANLDHFMQPGTLKIDSHEYPMPATIQDVMRLAIQLGVRHVWVDTLCIIQDGGDKISYLRGMAAIYASAYLTVISNGFDADFGLIGVGLGSKPRNRECRTLQLPNMSFSLIMDDNAVPPTNPDTWAKRAWTFQEGLFCRRMITFDLDGLVSWKCQRRFWSEVCEAPSESLEWAQKHPEESAPDWRYLGMAELNFQWPDMRRWCELMEEYHQRELSFDNDAFSALAGLISVVNHTSPGGLFYGLPEYFFDIFLLWDLSPGFQYSHPEPGDLKKVKPTRRTSPLVPSWSFLGWKHGKLDLHWWRMSMDHTFVDDMQNGFGSDVIIESIVTWNKRERDGDKLTPIANLYRRDRSLGDQGVLPPGWRREEDEAGTEWFCHEALQDEPFRYPVTLPSHQDMTVDHNRWSHRLHFQTTRAWLRLGPPIKPTEDERSYLGANKNVSLVDDEGRCVGAIRLLDSDDNEDDDDDEWEDVETDEDEELDRHDSDVEDTRSDSSKEPDVRVELIAVARGKVRNDSYPKKLASHGRFFSIPELNCKGRPKCDEFYEFYFVLWIEWQDGIAYRKALGRVEKKAWEALLLDNINVVLG